MSSQEKTQIVLFLQRQGFHLDPKSTSFNPGDFASGNAEWLLPTRKVDEEGHFHAGCDRLIPTNADPAGREIGDDAVTDEHLA